MKYCYALASLIILLFTSCKKDAPTQKVVIQNNPLPGTILASTITTGATAYGNLFFYDQQGNVLQDKSIGADGYDFRKWVVNGQTRYTYLEHDLSAAEITPISIVPSKAVILDENLNEIKRVSLLPNNGRTDADPSAVDCHDFIYIDDNHYIVLAYYQEAVSNIPAALNPVAGVKVVTPIIQEIQNGSVVFEWKADNNPEFYTSSVEGNKFDNGTIVHDYMHLNSMTIDPNDNNLVCSIRNLNQVIKIDRSTGAILWRLGGVNSNFPMTSDMKFLRQHDVTFTDNGQTLMIYDNGEATERPYTRVAEFNLNQSAKTVNTFKSFTLPMNIFSQFMGSVQKLGDRYFIGCGSEPKIMEVNYVTGDVNFLMQLDKPSYRAYKYQ
jgi:arylsulfate sulfotransferase